ncbi:MAG: hypothetical protein K8U57_04455 [Planctomycetes bacterium]|nr:hypothetical protein [Planctomycetota bacterium]
MPRKRDSRKQKEKAKAERRTRRSRPPADDNGAALQAAMVEDMKAVGIAPDIIYAFEKTGRLVTAMNQHLLSEEDLQEWDDAIDEWEEMYGAG